MQSTLTNLLAPEEGTMAQHLGAKMRLPTSSPRATSQKSALSAPRWASSLSPFLTKLLAAESDKTMAQHLAKPIGEGAYQDPEAVMERTKDKNKDCENSKRE